MSTRTDSLFPYTTRFRSPVDAPVRDVSIEGDRRDIITAAEIIFERRIEAVRLLRPEVGVAARSRTLDRVDVGDDKIGRASCRESVCQYVQMPVDAGSLTKKV